MQKKWIKNLKYTEKPNQYKNKLKNKIKDRLNAENLETYWKKLEKNS